MPSQYVVSLGSSDRRGLAAVSTRLPVARVAASFGEQLNKAYAAGKSVPLALDGQNVFVYRRVDGSATDVDASFGVGTPAPFAAVGDVEYVTLPAGSVATTTHWGDYGKLGDAHAAVIEWCRTNGRAPEGTRWEVYGHWVDGVLPRTDVFYLLSD